MSEITFNITESLIPHRYFLRNDKYTYKRSINISNIYTDEEYRKKGLATKLIKNVINFAINIILLHHNSHLLVVISVHDAKEVL